MGPDYLPDGEVSTKAWAKEDGHWDIWTAEGHHIQVPYTESGLFKPKGPSDWAENYSWFVANGFTPKVAMTTEIQGVPFEKVLEASQQYQNAA